MNKLSSCLVITLCSIAWSQEAQEGTSALAAPAPALHGKNLLAGAAWEYSLDDGKTWSADNPVVADGDVTQVVARSRFKVADNPAKLTGLELTHGLTYTFTMNFTLNGAPVPLPMEGLYYETIYGIPPALLKAGDNELFCQASIDNRPPGKDAMPPYKVSLKSQLCALTEADLEITSGPLVGATGKDWTNITARTNLPAVVTLKLSADGKTLKQVKSEPGLFHRFNLTELSLAPSAKPVYQLTATLGQKSVQSPSYPLGLLAESDKLRFVLMGDSRSQKAKWTAVAAAVIKARPQLVVFSGDMTICGKCEWLWQDHFLGVCPELFGTVPFYMVLGNHEEGPGMTYRLFPSPTPDGLGRDWTQQVGPVQFIGIDGQWAPKRDVGGWLKPVLENSKAKFIFLVMHYPPYSSGKNGALDPKTGQPTHSGSRLGRETIIPLLTKYKATAMVVGHEHCYERSELPEGLTLITSGGAGAGGCRLSDEAAKQNPYSKLFKIVNHYCLLEVNGDTCTFKAMTPDGPEIDSRSWKAREKP